MIINIHNVIESRSERFGTLYVSSIWILGPRSDERDKLVNDISEIIKEYEGIVSVTPFEASILVSNSFKYREAAEACRANLKLEYGN